MNATIAAIDEMDVDDRLRQEVKIVERRADDRTPLERIKSGLADFAVAFLRIFALALVFVPIVLASFLTVDLPFRAVDRFFADDGFRPSLFLTWGAAIMALTPMLAVLIARRFGGDEASRVVTASWAAAAVMAFAEISYLAPNLTAADFPSLRFVAAFVSSSMLAAYIAAATYDVTRGGGAWWRAPLYAVMAGYVAGGALYYAIGFWTSGAPWGHWLVIDVGVKFAFALGFLPLYAALRKPLRPRGGYGGY